MTTIDLTARRPGEVARAHRAFAAQAARDPFGHIKLRAELAHGNPYALAKLAALGLEYRGGVIVTKETP
jgi:hypothetical protein